LKQAQEKRFSPVRYKIYQVYARGKAGSGSMQRFVTSKWKKTKALIGDRKVKGHIPHTEKLQRSSLADMLSRYGMVYVKPEKGTFGNGVMRVERTATGFKYQVGTDIRNFTEFDALYNDLINSTRGKSYLVQKGIHLLKYHGRRFDIRVMVQKNPSNRWETTALVGRVAHPSKIVTNFHNGGTLKPVPALMSSHLSAAELIRFTNSLKLLGLRVASRLESRYPGIKEVGLDIAVDQSKRAWILEVNTCPDPYIFKVLKDKSVSRRVIRYARAYGRIKMSKK
jgi:glutathione synthase/RimK-type ligase-like ATP-grasp enzyme